MHIDQTHILTHDSLCNITYLSMYVIYVIIGTVKKVCIKSTDTNLTLKKVKHMAKTKTSSAVKNRYAAKAYDRIQLIVPKGRKATVQAHAEKKGESINGLVNSLLKADMGIADEEWKNAGDGEI